SIVWRELDLHFEYLRVLHTGLLWWESTFPSPKTSIPGCHSEQSSQKLSDSSPTYGKAVEVGEESLFLDESCAHKHGKHDNLGYRVSTLKGRNKIPNPDDCSANAEQLEAEWRSVVGSAINGARSWPRLYAVRRL
ncbi:MAG: hypothetical protein LKJ06_05095, partial [Schleiferilactobacillus harbinensis]|nr:hypothetical protein [Schleiferilactobacillus harbinensis]